MFCFFFLDRSWQIIPVFDGIKIKCLILAQFNLWSSKIKAICWPGVTIMLTCACKIQTKITRGCIMYNIKIMIQPHLFHSSVHIQHIQGFKYSGVDWMHRRQILNNSKNLILTNLKHASKYLNWCSFLVVVGFFCEYVKSYLPKWITFKRTNHSTSNWYRKNMYV